MVATGAGLGLLIGLIVTALTDAPTAGSLLATTIAMALIGSLTALYVRLPMSTEVADGNTSTVRVNADGLDQQTVAELARMLTNA